MYFFYLVLMSHKKSTKFILNIYLYQIQISDLTKIYHIPKNMANFFPVGIYFENQIIECFVRLVSTNKGKSTGKVVNFSFSCFFYTR